MGLLLALALDNEYGTYFGPGSEERPYAGKVVGPVRICLLKGTDLRGSIGNQLQH